MAEVAIQPARAAYEAVLADSGATLPKRDSVDLRVIEEVRTGRPTYNDGIITDPQQVGGYPKYAGEPLADADHDGMPDAWESAHGLNPNDPSDAAKDSTGDGYTNIEKYLNDIGPTTKAGSTAQGDPEADYTKAINQRATDAIAVLGLTDAAKSEAVHAAIVEQYRALRAWHDANDAKLKDKTTDAAARSAIAASRKELHDRFIAKLAAELTPEQVEQIKDKMVYGKVQVTYNAYVAMVGTLNDDQKSAILDMLKEAREEAMDGGSADEKSAVFKKYKGKINNYLASQGIDMKKAEKVWGQQQKEKQAATRATTATATQAAGEQ
jgi:hypothetical protein